jgi:hypothetical protein
VQYARSGDHDADPARSPANMAGILLYIKPSLTGREIQDVATYAAAHPSFPHEPTSDQYFDEAQFECYRRLGRSAGDEALSKAISVARSRCHDEAFLLSTSTIKDTFVSELTSQLSRRTNISREASARTAASLMSLYSELRENKALASLDADFYPAWGDIRPARASGELKQQWPSETDFRECFYFCHQLIQFMESVYREMNLEHLAVHPDNRGWMNTFRQWSWSPMLRLTWTAGAARLSKGFVDFCRANLNLPDPRIGATSIETVEIDLDTWEPRLDMLRDEGGLNELERAILLSDALRKYRSVGTQIFLLKFDWNRIFIPVARELGTTTIGFAVVNAGCIRLLRIQNHVRFMGLATRFLKHIFESPVAEGGKKVETVQIAPGDYGLAGYCGDAEAAKLSALLQAILDRLRT